MGNRILYSNVRAQTGPQLRGKIQFVVRHFEFVTVEFFVAHALWFFRLVYVGNKSVSPHRHDCLLQYLIFTLKLFARVYT